MNLPLEIIGAAASVLTVLGVGVGAGLVWARRQLGPTPKSRPKSDPPSGAAAAPHQHQRAGDSRATGEFPPIHELCPEHAAIAQRHAASEKRLERIEGKQDLMGAAIARIEGALAQPNGGGGRRA